MRKYKINFLKYFITLLFLVCIFYSSDLIAQRSAMVKGIVKNSNNEPLPGVSVIINNTKTQFSAGTSTDNSGVFTFSKISPGGSYNFTCSIIGYEDQKLSGYSIEEGRLLSLTVQLKGTAATLDQVIVVGYGTQKKVSLTGAVSQIKGEDLERRAE